MKSLFIPETWDDINELSEKDIKDIIDNYEKVMRMNFEIEKSLEILKNGRKNKDFDNRNS